VTLTDFVTRYSGPVASADEDRIQALLSDACDMAQDIMKSTYGEDDEIPGAIIAVVVAAVGRVYSNPQGLTGETIGNYSWQGRASGVGIHFTLQEKQTLRRAAGKLGVGQAQLEGYLPYAPRAEQYVEVGEGGSVLYYAEEDLLS